MRQPIQIQERDPVGEAMLGLAKGASEGIQMAQQQKLQREERERQMQEQLRMKVFSETGDPDVLGESIPPGMAEEIDQAFEHQMQVKRQQQEQMMQHQAEMDVKMRETRFQKALAASGVTEKQMVEQVGESTWKQIKSQALFPEMGESVNKLQQGMEKRSPLEDAPYIFRDEFENAGTSEERAEILQGYRMIRRYPDEEDRQVMQEKYWKYRQDDLDPVASATRAKRNTVEELQKEDLQDLYEQKEELGDTLTKLETMEEMLEEGGQVERRAEAAGITLESGMDAREQSGMLERVQRKKHFYQQRVASIDEEIGKSDINQQDYMSHVLPDQASQEVRNILKEYQDEQASWNPLASTGDIPPRMLREKIRKRSEALVNETSTLEGNQETYGRANAEMWRAAKEMMGEYSYLTEENLSEAMPEEAAEYFRQSEQGRRQERDRNPEGQTQGGDLERTPTPGRRTQPETEIQPETGTAGQGDIQSLRSELNSAKQELSQIAKEVQGARGVSPSKSAQIKEKRQRVNDLQSQLQNSLEKVSDPDSPEMGQFVSHYDETGRAHISPDRVGDFHDVILSATNGDEREAANLIRELNVQLPEYEE